MKKSKNNTVKSNLKAFKNLISVGANDSEIEAVLECVYILEGNIDEKIVSTNTIKELASIPPKEVLLARLVSSLNSPVSGMVGVLSGVIRKLVYALNTIKDNKGGEKK